MLKKKTTDKYSEGIFQGNTKELLEILQLELLELLEESREELRKQFPEDILEVLSEKLQENSRGNSWKISRRASVTNLPEKITELLSNLKIL